MSRPTPRCPSQSREERSLCWSWVPWRGAEFRLPHAVSSGPGLVHDLHLRIPRHLPQMIVGVLKIAGVAAPECLRRRLDYPGPRPTRLFHDRVDFLLAADIVADGELRGAVIGSGNTRIMGNVGAR